MQQVCSEPSQVVKIHKVFFTRIFTGMKKRDERQLELPLAGKPKLTVIKGEGKRIHEPLQSRDAVARVLIEAGADLLLRRISHERAEEIEQRVDEILNLFDKVDRRPALMNTLKEKLDDLEQLMRETRKLRSHGHG